MIPSPKIWNLAPSWDSWVWQPVKVNCFLQSWKNWFRRSQFSLKSESDRSQNCIRNSVGSERHSPVAPVSVTVHCARGSRTYCGRTYVRLIDRRAARGWLHVQVVWKIETRIQQEDVLSENLPLFLQSYCTFFTLSPVRIGDCCRWSGFRNSLLVWLILLM